MNYNYSFKIFQIINIKEIYLNLVMLFYKESFLIDNDKNFSLIKGKTVKNKSIF